MTKQLPPSLRKAFLNVSRRPHTVHESSAILGHLYKHYGPVVYFRPLSPTLNPTVKAPADDRAIYQILFDVTHATTSILKTRGVDESFHVAVPASDPDVEDPFNVRGLHGRVPVQAEDVTFECELSDTPPAGLVAHSTGDEWPITTIATSLSYKAAKQGVIFDALQATGAPRGLVRNLVPLPESNEPVDHVPKHGQGRNERRKTS